jgi:hypothetical protein
MENGDNYPREFEAMLEDDEMENFGESSSNDFGDRFYELSLQEFEFETDLDREINRLLDGMEQEYFFGSLKKLGSNIFRKGKKIFNSGRKLVNRVKSNPLFKTLKSISSPLDAFKKISSFLPSSLKPMLANLAKTGLASFVPGGAAALPILQGLGFGLKEFETSSDPETSRQAWRNFAEVATRSYELLMDHAEGDLANPLQANKIASQALAQALSEKGIRTSGSIKNNGRVTPAQRIIRLRPGQKVTLVVDRS